MAIASQSERFRGWGIKNPFLFSQSLATKTLWCLIKNPESLWGKVLISKYCPNGSIQDWISKGEKSFKNGSIGWKALVLAFPQVGNWLAWLVENGREVRVGEDPWSGSGESFKLSEGLVLKLRSLGIFTLNQACSLSLQRETLWKNSEDLGLEEGLKEEWEEYVSLLKSSLFI